jgi:hypothetical protein
MSFLSKLTKQVAPIVATVAPFVPGGQAIGTVASLYSAREAQKQNTYNRKLAEQQRKAAEMQYFDQRGGGFTNTAVAQGSTQQSGFSSFLSDISQNYLRPGLDFLGEAGALFRGPSRPQNVQQQPAVTTITNLGSRETQSSGTNEAFIGGLGNVLGQASRFLRTPTGSIGTGLIGGIAGNLLGSEPRQMRVTRKTKRLAQQAYSLAMGDLSTATQLFQQLSGLSVGEQQFVLILTKRFRNDGAVVTRAALRKTKSTIRRLKGMCDMYDSLRPSATRRRAPMKRATTTLIKN